VHINGKTKGKSIKEWKWHANQSDHELGGNFAKPILTMAILRSRVLKVANTRFSQKKTKAVHEKKHGHTWMRSC
jgi:hypothetical protein